MNLEDVPVAGVAEGDILLSPRLRLVLVDQIVDEVVHGRYRDGSRIAIRPDKPVRRVILDERERVVVRRDSREIERLAGQSARAARFAVGPFPTRNLQNALSHLWVMHGTWVGDVKDIGEALRCHRTLHADERHLMAYAHHHGRSKG